MHRRPTDVYIHHHACKRSCNCQRCQLYFAKLCELPRCKKKHSHVNGISELKRYVHHKFSNITDIFDAQFEAAIVRYQAKLGLQITGKLDFDTLNQIMAPTEFDQVIAFSDVKEVFKSAFAKWGSVIPVSFVQTDDYVFADIKTGFYSEDHGDGEPFDGVSGVLARSFSPESGKFHLDVDETWAIDFGLAHASVEEAVMHPSLEPGKKKLHLTIDDIQGEQALYGSNPNFTLGDHGQGLDYTTEI
ncbi:hypothetical protein POTOM_008245 [Populus tomentosa]|uniref:Peptidase metallopeptidase domain-containing protein n=1 Tax=Populus tomentosa TaxID=118781 RepID=A0A8X8AC32_POPTO|nr:hypothetical protein POTOM_008245 [Populus tomentosa]